MVIDDHHIGGHGLAAGLIDMTGPKARALRPQAVLACGRDPGDYRRAFIQPRQFSQITGCGPLCPLLDLGKRRERRAFWKSRVMTGHLHAMQAQVTPPALEECRADGNSERLDQRRQIPPEQLVLKRFGCS
jgi:hypothetical protein